MYSLLNQYFIYFLIYLTIIINTLTFILSNFCCPSFSLFWSKFTQNLTKSFSQRTKQMTKFVKKNANIPSIIFLTDLCSYLSFYFMGVVHCSCLIFLNFTPPMFGRSVVGENEWFPGWPVRGSYYHYERAIRGTQDGLGTRGRRRNKTGTETQEKIGNSGVKEKLEKLQATGETYLILLNFTKT